MSKDGYLPDNVSEADFDKAFPPDPEHLVSCPLYEDIQEDLDDEPNECTCPTPAELNADAAEASADARNDRSWEDEMGGGR